MQKERVVYGQTEEEVWDALKKDLQSDDSLLDYHALIEQGDRDITLDIDIDPGGGFDNGDAYTAFRSSILKSDFRLAVHHENFVDEIGKFLGMQDVVIGYPEFDKKLVIKTNDGPKARIVFAEPQVREVLQSLENFSLETERHEVDEKDNSLLLNIEEGITDPEQLKLLYHAFITLLIAIDAA
jgi:hypothetical protein